MFCYRKTISLPSTPDAEEGHIVKDEVNNNSEKRVSIEETNGRNLEGRVSSTTSQRRRYSKSSKIFDTFPWV